MVLVGVSLRGNGSSGCEFEREGSSGCEFEREWF